MRPGSTGEVVYGVVCWYVNPTLGIEEMGGKEKKRDVIFEGANARWRIILDPHTPSRGLPNLHSSSPNLTSWFPLTPPAAD